MKIIQCDEALHSSNILEIFNHEIINSTALFDYKARTMENMTVWFENKRKGLFPVIGAINDDGNLIGFVSYGEFRSWPAYKYTIEHSIYVDKRFRGQGISHKLLNAMINTAKEQNYHVIVAGIESKNAISIRLHEKHGFKFCGRIEQAGFKFGNWLDLNFMQLALETPLNPVDG